MSSQPWMMPSPRHAEVLKCNRAKRKGLTEEGRKRLREAAMATKPWQHAKGPTTSEGRKQSVINGKVRQKGEFSVREARAQVKANQEMLRQITAQSDLWVFESFQDICSK